MNEHKLRRTRKCWHAALDAIASVWWPLPWHCNPFSIPHCQSQSYSRFPAHYFPASCLILRMNKQSQGHTTTPFQCQLLRLPLGISMRKGLPPHFAILARLNLLIESGCLKKIITKRFMPRRSPGKKCCCYLTRSPAVSGLNINAKTFFYRCCSFSAVSNQFSTSLESPCKLGIFFRFPSLKICDEFCRCVWILSAYASLGQI